MRDIKYRVWCDKTKKLYNNVDSIEWLLSGHVIRATTILSEEETHYMHNEYDGIPYNKPQYRAKSAGGFIWKYLEKHEIQTKQ